MALGCLGKNGDRLSIKNFTLVCWKFWRIIIMQANKSNSFRSGNCFRNPGLAISSLHMLRYPTPYFTIPYSRKMQFPWDQETSKTPCSLDYSAFLWSCKRKGHTEEISIHPLHFIILSNSTPLLNKTQGQHKIKISPKYFHSL